MSLPVELPIYHHTDGTSTCRELDIEYHISECEVRTMCFYHISAIGPASEKDGFQYTVIHAGDSNFACALNYEQLKQKLK